MGIIGIAHTAITSGATGTIRLWGTYTNTGWSWSGVRKKLYLSGTAGTLTETHTEGSVIVGISLSATTILLAPYLFEEHHNLVRIGALSATSNFYLFIEDQPVTLEEFEIISDVTTAGSDGSNYWSFEIYNLTQANSIVTKTTNGAEITADTPWELGTLSNADIAPHDLLELRVVLVGAPTSLATAEVAAVVEWGMRL
jgi:hypothetical protein